MLLFNKEDIGEDLDPYKKKDDEKELNDFVLSKMFGLQEKYEGKKMEGLENYIKNKMDEVDVEYEYETADENKIFKSFDNKMVDL